VYNLTVICYHIPRKKIVVRRIEEEFCFIRSAFQTIHTISNNSEHTKKILENMVIVYLTDNTTQGQDTSKTVLVATEESSFKKFYYYIS